MTDAGPADFASLGIVVGHAQDDDGATGVTVIRGVDAPLVAAAATLGRATGTRELHAVSPEHLVGRADAILLAGGSAYGLDAAAGAMRWCEARGRGFAVGGGVVPIVPAAVVFDLAPLGRFDARPTADMVERACDDAVSAPAEGSVGAGTGATVGKALGAAGAMKGGVGCAIESGGESSVGALVVVNAFGDVRNAQGAIIAGARDAGGGFADGAAIVAGDRARASFADAAGRNTTLAVVITDVPLSRTQLAQLARAAGAALYRRITPVGTSFDGDVVFAVRASSARYGAADAAPDDDRAAPLPVLLRAEALAVRALERAVERAVRLARGRDGVPGLADA